MAKPNKRQALRTEKVAEKDTYEIAKLRSRLPVMNLRAGQTYHAPLRGGKGHVVVKRQGNNFSIRRVQGPPPGIKLPRTSGRLKTSKGFSGLGLQKGDVLVTTPKKSESPTLSERTLGGVFGHLSSSLQGSHTHAAIYVGNGQVVEARAEDGVKKRSLEDALKGIDSAIVVRPKTSKKNREGAARFAETRLGRKYDMKALAGAGGSLVLPKKMYRLVSKRKNPEDAQNFICSNLVSAAYVTQGFSPRGKDWDLTVPRDFLDPKHNKKVGVIGKNISENARFGQFAGKQKIARAPRDYAREYQQYHSKKNN